jgi:hypothetical protein
MNEQLEIGGYIIAFDRAATLAAYSLFAQPEPEKCGCWYCRNWAAGRANTLPAKVRELLEQIGVPESGEIEVWQVPGQHLKHIYGGWYMFVGTLSAIPESNTPFIVGDWTLSFSSTASYPMTQFGNAPVCELHFVTEVGDFIPPE